VQVGGYMGEKYIASGFTKVSDNEWNAKLVVEFCLEMSKIIPNAKIYCHDEGDYILCSDIIIQNGVVSPDVESIQQSFKYWYYELSPQYTYELVMKVNNAIESKNYFAEVRKEDYDEHPEFRTIVLG
jgi:hypothetical protein